MKAIEPKQNSLRVISAEDVTEKAVSFLWDPFIPLGKLTFLEGDPEAGKTYIALALAAAITSGRLIEVDGFLSSDPHGFHCLAPIDGQKLIDHYPRRKVAYFSAEDDLADTLKPRFMNQGGYEKNLKFIQMDPAKEGEPQTPMFSLSDTVTFRRALDEAEPILVVLDPIQAFLGSGVDMNRANEVRPVLAGIQRIAEDYNCAILVIRHITKAGYAGKALYRGQGSIDFAAAARSILVAAAHPTDPDCCALAHSKSSLSMKGPTLLYKIDDDGLHWLGSEHLTADELLSPPRNPSSSRQDLAEEFLRNALANGDRSANDTEADGKASGFSAKTLERARKSLGVVAKPGGFQKPWLWSLPQGASAPEEAQGPSAKGGAQEAA